MRRHRTHTTALKTTLASAALVALAASLTACGSDDGNSAQDDDTTAAAAAGSQESAGTEPDAIESDAGAGSFEPGSTEQVEAVRACFSDLGLPVIDTPQPQRPEHLLSIDPVDDGVDEGFVGQVYFFESEARALEERPNVTFFDEDTEFDSTVGNVLVVYFPAPSRAGGLEQGIEDCLA